MHTRHVKFSTFVIFNISVSRFYVLILRMLLVHYVIHHSISEFSVLLNRVTILVEICHEINQIKTIQLPLKCNVRRSKEKIKQE